MQRITFNNIDVPKIILPREYGGIFGGEFDEHAVPTFSGKSSIALLLAYFRSTGTLPNKSAQVLVPPWMGYWVYMIMHKYCFPTTAMNADVRGVLLYHQWGFPQKIEEVLRFAKKKKLFVIEDCAHSFEGYSGSIRLGTFGDASVFSLAKFFPCVVGGAVYTRDNDIRRFVVNATPSKESALEKNAFIIRRQFDKDPSVDNQIKLEQSYAIYDKLLKCNTTALRIASHERGEGALLKRKVNVARLRDEFAGRDKFGLFTDNIAPWIVPLFFEKEKMVHISKALIAHGVESGIFRFDVNRNMLDPDYRECVGIPCHDGIGEFQMDQIARIIHKHSK